LVYAGSGYDWEDIESPRRGEAEIAGKYLEWAQTAVKEGRGADASNALRRALDYADISSDISYLLATVENDMPLPSRTEVLIHVNLAIGTDRWNYYSLNDAYILKARILIELTRFAEALRIIPLISDSLEKELLRLRALLYSKQHTLFIEAAERAMNLYPAGAEIAALILKYAGSPEYRETDGGALLSLVLRRLGALLERDGDLLWRAAAFMPDIEEAARQARSWLSSVPEDSAIPKAALPVLLNLGVIDEERATAALFAAPAGNKEDIVIDKNNLISVYNLLRTKPSREVFAAKLSNYSGIIHEDKNNDGIYESISYYRNGFPRYYFNDKRQERVNNLVMEWKAAEPLRAVLSVTDEDADIITLMNAPLLQEELFVHYDIYPAVKKVEFRKNEYYFRMEDFYYAPLIFNKLIPDSEMIFPEINNGEDVLALKTLYSFAYIIERPSKEFQGAVERVKLLDGVIVEASETLDGIIISETEFVSGRPRLQKVDMDLDGRMETLRFFKQGENEIDYAQSDWDGDGIYE
jgi:hypothetical protein